MDQSSQVQDHYTVGDTLSRVDSALMEAGFASGVIDWKLLAQLDQFHMRGLDATRELAAGLELGSEKRILDVGSGLGGPARYLAATYNSQVTGIELTPIFVEISRLLTERTGLSKQIEFVEGDALAMPFEKNSFDAAWTQHVAMNIEDKDQLYREVFRILKPGSRFGIYDVVAGNGPMTFPLPWASSGAHSFVVSPEVLEQKLRIAGFEVLTSQDTSAEALDWFSEFQKTLQRGEGRSPLSLGAILGPQAKEVTQNFATNLKNGTAKLIQVIAVKPSTSEASV